MIRPVRAAEYALWDGYVARHAEGSFCALSGHLRALEQSTGYRVARLGAFDGDRLVGVLAWCVTRGRAVSLPFYEYGGPLADDAAIAAELLAGARPLEVRGVAPDSPGRRVGDFAVLDLPSLEAVEAGYDRSLRKALRKAERDGVRVVHVTAPEHLVGEFAPAYERWMRDRHGTPPLSQRYWRAVAGELRGVWRLVEARQGGRPRARLLGYRVGRRVAITQIVSDPEGWESRAVDAAHAAFVRWAVAAGCERFDFGAVRYEGQRRYKLKWGCRLIEYRVAGGAPVVPEGPLGRLARGAWRRLPLSWCRVLGPPLREWLTV